MATPWNAIINGATAGFGILQNALRADEQRSMNEWQKDFSNRQFAFQKYQYENMKKYNSMQEQVARMRAAGLNPAFALGGLNAGQAQSVGGSAAPTLELPPSADLSALGGISSGLILNSAQKRVLDSEASKNEADTRNKEIENLFAHEDWKSKIYGRDTQSWLNDQLAQVAKLNVEFDKRSMEDRLKAISYENQYKDSLITAQDITNQFLPTQLAETCAELVARQFAAYATGRASLSQAHSAMMRAVNEQHAFDALYGGNPSERSNFYKATLDGLLKLNDVRESEVFKNISGKNPLPYNIHNWEAYDAWRKGRNPKTMRW